MPAQQQQVAPTPAPLPGGFKSMKNRWLAEFEAEQAAKQVGVRCILLPILYLDCHVKVPTTGLPCYRRPSGQRT
jgi:hypothetical protein